MRPLTSFINMVHCSPPMPHLSEPKSDSARWLTVFSRPGEAPVPERTDQVKDRFIPHEVGFHCKN